MRVYSELVEAFYTTPFMEIFLEPRPKFKVPRRHGRHPGRGNSKGGWAMDWRPPAFFFWLVKSADSLGRWCQEFHSTTAGTFFTTALKLIRRSVSARAVF